jgi:KDO2-lipid IV(A) lauroyltransferase
MIHGLLYSSLLIMSRIPYPLAVFAGKLMGSCFSRLPILRREVALANIMKSFEGEMEERECREILKRAYIHFGRMIFEVPHILNLNQENLDRYVIFENEETLRNALARGKGVFMLTAHFGNWELMSAAVSMRFGGAAIVVRPIDFAPLDRVMARLRTRFGTELIPKQGAVKRMIGALREKKMLGILLDQNVDWYEGVFTPFMGRWACTNKGLALLALRTGAPVVPAFSVRQEDGRHRIIFEREVQLVTTGDKITQVEENTILFAKVIETYIRRYPDHWFWFHRRWKTRNYCELAGQIPSASLLQEGRTGTGFPILEKGD